MTIPTIAWSHGKDVGNLHNSCASTTSQPKFWETHVSCFGNHRLYLNSAGGSNECLPGSVYSLYDEFDKMWEPNWWCGGPLGGLFLGATVDVLANPTFIPTESSLVNRHLNKDFWYASTNGTHVAPLPEAASKMVMGWFSEYVNGTKDRPVCGHPKKGVGYGSTCRPAVDEVPGNGMDDDGDERIDEIDTPPPPTTTFSGSGTAGYSGSKCLATYTFPTTAGKTYTISTCGSYSGDPYLKVSGTCTCSNDDACYRGSSCSCQATGSGTATICASTYSSTSASWNYVVTASASQPAVTELAY